jgi:hypothetical protein
MHGKEDTLAAGRPQALLGGGLDWSILPIFSSFDAIYFLPFGAKHLF